MAKKQPKEQVAVIYARISPRRDGENCDSIQSQIDYCTKYCEFNKFRVLASYSDELLSGADTHNRPGLLKALDEVIMRNGVLVIYSLSRMCRSVRDALIIVERLKASKSHICSVTEHLDTTSPMGSFIFTAFAAMAQLEREISSERTRDAVLYYQLNGRRMSHDLPYGWRQDPDDPARMLPDDQELDVITQVLNLRYHYGFSFREIAEQIADWGFIPRPKEINIKGQPRSYVSGKFTFSSVRNILNGQMAQKMLADEPIYPRNTDDDEILDAKL